MMNSDRKQYPLVCFLIVSALGLNGCPVHIKYLDPEIPAVTNFLNAEVNKDNALLISNSDFSVQIWNKLVYPSKPFSSIIRMNFKNVSKDMLIVNIDPRKVKLYFCNNQVAETDTLTVRDYYQYPSIYRKELPSGHENWVTLRFLLYGECASESPYKQSYKLTFMAESIEIITKEGKQFNLPNITFRTEEK